MGLTSLKDKHFITKLGEIIFLVNNPLLFYTVAKSLKKANELKKMNLSKEQKEALIKLEKEIAKDLKSLSPEDQKIIKELFKNED